MAAMLSLVEGAQGQENEEEERGRLSFCEPLQYGSPGCGTTYTYSEWLRSPGAQKFATAKCPLALRPLITQRRH